MDILFFGADPVFRQHRRGLFEALYLLNLWMDADEICIVTSLGWGKTVIRLSWPWPHFKVTCPPKQSILGQKKACLHSIS